MFAKAFLHQSPKGFTALLVLIVMLSGILLFFLGIIGEYVGRIYEETKARPHYIIGSVISAGRSDSAAQRVERVSQRTGRREYFGR